MNIRLYNARILTMERNKDIFHGEIWIKNDKIAYIAADDELNEEWDRTLVPHITWDIEMDCEDNLLLPGFKDAHTHSAMTFLRSLADDLPLDRWLNEQVFPLEAKLTPDDIYEFTRLAILEYLTSGITAIQDMYLNPDAVGEACLDSGMRVSLVPGLNNFVSSIRQVEEEYGKWNKRSPLANYQLGFHAEYTCSGQLLRELSGLAHHYRAPIYAHVSETSKEVLDCKKRNGMSPIMYLDSLGLFDFGGAAYHCVHVDAMDMETLRRHGLYVVTNPGSNTKLASGVAPIVDFRNHKLPIAIGTDGAASNNCLDMFREMFLVAGLSKLREMDAASIDATAVLRMATAHGAKSMRFTKADVLAKGKYADIVLIDLHQPNMQPIHHIAKNLVYSGSKSNVLMTMVGGKILYRKGEFNIGENPERIYERCERIVRRILSE